MKDWRAFGKRLLFPPIWALLVLTVVSTAGLVMVFWNGLDGYPISYVVYGLSFYTLCVDTAFCCTVLPKQYRLTKQKIQENKYANRYLTDVAFKTNVSLYLSLSINLLYIATNAVSAVTNHSVWFGIYAVYYAIMAVMRFMLVRTLNRVGIHQNPVVEWKRSRLCAYILMTVNLALSAVVLMMVNSGSGFSYQGYMIYVMAMYTFYVTTSAMIDIVKYQKYASPVLSMSKIIKLASSLMSMLALETAMFAQFGSDSALESQNGMIMATGGGIAGIVTVMSVSVIVRSTKEIKKESRK